MQDIFETKNMYDVFSKVLFKNDTSLYPREEQLQLSEKIVETIESGGTLIAEAGTGIGKSFAYLVPALLYAHQGYKVIIITATINLQHQLYDNDIPRLQKLLNTDISVTVLKGKQNYLCRDRAFSMLQLDQENLFNIEGMKELYQWIKNTKTGDKEELLKQYNISSALWNDICADLYYCGGSMCARKNHGGCFFNEAKKKIYHAGIIITNYSMLAVHLRTLLQHDRKKNINNTETTLLPEDAIYILDEAHKLSSIIRDGLSESISEQEYHRIHNALIGKNGIISEVRKKQGELRQDQIQPISFYEKQFDIILQHITTISQLITEYLRHSSEIERSATSISIHYDTILNDVSISNKIVNEFSDISKHIDLLLQHLTRIKDAFPSEAALENTIQNQCRWWEQQQILTSQFSENVSNVSFIRWCELREEKKQTLLTFFITQLMVNNVLEQYFFNRIPVSICTSATLSTFKNFEFWKRQTGTEHVSNTILLPSPFPYKDRVLLSIPQDAPSVQDYEQYIYYLQSQLTKLIQLTNGKTLILCTSNAMVHQIGTFLKTQFQNSIWNILAQDGHTSTTSLAKQFREDIHSVLVATNSFWEGFDAPGETLRLLVLTRIPFTSPSNLFFKEESRTLEQYGKNPFFSLSLPQAEMRLRQGFGRLMRHHTDGGVVFISDNRMLSKKYGNQLIETLPECKTCFQDTNTILVEMEHHLANL